MFVSGVAVNDQVQGLVLGRLAIDLAQELQPLGIGVALVAFPDDPAAKLVERGE